LASAGTDIECILQVTEEAAVQAARVLKAEWKRVKCGESKYRHAVRTASSLLIATGVILMALIAIVFFGDGPAKSNTASKSAESATTSLAPTKPSSVSQKELLRK
jgi:hypothetical protein